MARPKKIPTELIVDRACRHFWAHGFADSSLESLELATGTGRKGLYNEFESKAGLLVACLHYYRITLIGPYLGDLEHPGAGRDAVISVFSKLALEWSEDYPAGCLVCNVSREDIANEPKIAAEIDAYWAMCTERFSRGIGNAQQAGEMDHAIDRDAAALYLLTVLQGVCVMETSGADLKAMPGVVEIALSKLHC